MKKNDIIKEYVRRLNDDELRFLSLRLGQRLNGDVGEAVEFMQRHQDVDRCLSSAASADSFFDLVDMFDGQIQSEIKKRF